jgi:hypothetical protein
MVWTTETELALRFVAIGTRLFGRVVVTEPEPGSGWQLEIPAASGDQMAALWSLIFGGQEATWGSHITLGDLQEWVDEQARREAAYIAAQANPRWWDEASYAAYQAEP